MYNKLTAEWNKTIISITIVLSLALSIYVLSDPVGSSIVLANIYNLLAAKFESTYMYGGFIVFLFLLIISISRYGEIRVILPNKDIHSFFSWGSMLFAAGIGAALLYWATVEWIEYYNILNKQNIQIDEKLLYSRAYPIFHWSFTAWAIYCLPAVAFGIALTKNKNSKLTFSGIFNIKNKFFEILFDTLFIGAIICGAGVGLGLSFPLIATILSKILYIERSIYLDIFTIIICLSIFSTSAYLGIKNGIRILSNFNILLVIVFLLLIFILGPSKYIFFNSLESYTFLSKKYFEFSFSTGTNISKDWTVFYWAWWMALAPMVGAFVVNISNGKTLRQIILGTILIGSLGCILSMSILTNLSMHLFESNILNAPELILSNSMTREDLIVETFASLEFSRILLVLFGIICIIFLCTTYDSTSYILASASMKSSGIESSGNLRLIFAILLVVQPTLLMFLGGVNSFKWIMVIFSVPLILIYILLMIFITKNVYTIKKP
jgi:BCCT family betaine/carnitine transporter